MAQDSVTIRAPTPLARPWLAQKNQQTTPRPLWLGLGNASSRLGIALPGLGVGPPNPSLRKPRSKMLPSRLGGEQVDAEEAGLRLV